MILLLEKFASANFLSLRCCSSSLFTWKRFLGNLLQVIENCKYWPRVFRKWLASRCVFSGSFALVKGFANTNGTCGFLERLAAGVRNIL